MKELIKKAQTLVEALPYIREFYGKTLVAKKVDISNMIDDGGDIAEDADLGMVGEVERINPQLIKVLESAGFITVIAPIGFDEEGRSYNINADHVQGKIAEAVKAEKLILLTDVPGILDEEKNLISSLTESTAREL